MLQLKSQQMAECGLTWKGSVSCVVVGVNRSFSTPLEWREQHMRIELLEVEEREEFILLPNYQEVATHYFEEEDVVMGEFILTVHADL